MLFTDTLQLWTTSVSVIPIQYITWPWYDLYMTSMWPYSQISTSASIDTCNLAQIYRSRNIGKLETKFDYAAQSPSFWSSDKVLVVREIQGCVDSPRWTNDLKTNLCFTWWCLCLIFHWTNESMKKWNYLDQNKVFWFKPGSNF